MFTKEQFKNLDLRSQLTEELRSKWYYKQCQEALKINKHSVVFDDSFKFELKYHPADVVKETKDVIFEKDIIIEGIVEFKKGEVIHYEKGEVISDAFVTIQHDDETLEGRFYEYEEKYSDSPKDILEDILLYIVNYI